MNFGWILNKCNKCQDFPDLHGFFLLAFLPSGGDSAAASDSCLGLTIFGTAPAHRAAPGWIKQEATNGPTVDPPFVSSTYINFKHSTDF